MIIVDSSTIIKGFFARYPEPRFIVDKIADGTFQLAMTEEMAKELQVAVLATSDKYGKNPKPFLRSVASFIFHAKTIPSLTKFPSCSDPDDSMFIECAIDGGIKHVISSDPSIFTIKEYLKESVEFEMLKDIEFYNPESFYNLYQSKHIIF
ncbi:putative toxin-antitoxin system toxin component, PIN family [Peribacillus sp. NPDC060186]